MSQLLPSASPDSTTKNSLQAFTRRSWLRHLGQFSFVAYAAPVAGVLTGCASHAASSGAVAHTVNSSWSTGGTKRIADAVRKANPFLTTATSSCHLTCETTIGPCHTESPLRSDISDGWDGIPMHIQLRVVNSQCQPVANAMVEIWHTNYTGGYSGQIHPMCNNNAQDTQRQFFRGYQRTDAQGIARFDSCYPGWYSSRANHVHIRVLQGDYKASDSASAALVTQLLYPDALNNEIFSNIPLYKTKGLPDTTLNADNVVGEEPDKSPYLFDIQNIGGVMLASKTLSIRENLNDAICRARGKAPPRGPGGRGGPPAGPPGGAPGFGPPNGARPRPVQEINRP